MPLYEYKCNACGHRFEVIQKFSDKPVKKCPKCAKTGKVERLVSSSTFQLKGSGWYITDYARKSSPSDTRSESQSESKSETKDAKDSPKESAPASTEKSSAKDSSKDSGSSPLSTSPKKPKKD